MLKLIACVAGMWVFGAGVLPSQLQAQTAPPAAPAATGLAGLWKGPLSTPGGSLPILITIGEQGPNKPVATLDLPAKRLTRIPTSVAQRGDTLVIYAVTVDSRFACVPTADGQTLRGIWSQPGLRVPLTLRRTSTTTEAGAATGGAPVVAVVTTYHVEQMKLVSQPGEVSLAGTLSIPDGAGPFPAVVLLSDMGGQDRDARQGNYRLFASMATALARQGIAVLRLDDRGVGQSGGNGTQATTADLVRDAQAALNFLRLRPSLDAARIGLIGHGEGGNVALLAAAQPLPPSFVVAMAASGLVGMDLMANQPEPIANPADTARLGAARRQAWVEVLAKAEKLRASGSNSAQVETYMAQQRLKVKSEDRKKAEATLRFRRTMLDIVRQTANDDQAQAIVVNMLRQRYPDQDPNLGRRRATQLITPWSRYYLKFDPQVALPDVKCPVLLVQGTDDDEVNAAANLVALEKGLRANKRVAVRRLPGVNHQFQLPADVQLASADGTLDPIVSPAFLNAVREWIRGEAQN